MKTNRFPMNLQLFAEPSPEGESGGTQPTGQGTGQQNAGGGAGQQNPTPQFHFDYEKLASIIDGAKDKKEDTVLRSYFKEQGLSMEEVQEAMKQFKEQKAQNTPDTAALQTQLNEALQNARNAAIEKTATIEAVALGVDTKTIPYLLKMADLEKAVGADGTVDNEKVKTALNEVLEAVPQLKPQQGQSAGFMQVGAGKGENNVTQDSLSAIFGNKK